MWTEGNTSLIRDGTGIIKFSSEQVKFDILIRHPSRNLEKMV